MAARAMTLAPHIEGAIRIRSSATHFAAALHRRIEAGLLGGHPHPRSNYRVVEAAPGRLQFRAADWWTAINVGLNECELRLTQPGCIHYQVRFWRWALYALGLSGILGLVGLVLFLTVDVRTYIADHQESRLPGLSVNQNLVVAWAMVVFWGFAWPWLLIALHKRPLRRLVARLISEVDAGAAARSPRSRMAPPSSLGGDPQRWPRRAFP